MNASKSIRTAALLTLIPLLTACSDEEPFGLKRYNAAYIEAPQQIAFDAQKQQDITITASEGMPWQLSADYWIKVSADRHTGTGSITVSVADNPNATERTGTIRVQGGLYNRNASIQVRQAATYINVSPEDAIDFDAEGQTRTISVIANAAWQVKWPERNSPKEWLTIAPTSGREGTTVLTLTAAKNEDSAARTGNSFSIVSGNVSTEVQVAQSAAQNSLLITPSGTVSFTADGKTVEGNSTQQIAITTNTEAWSYDISYDQYASEEWISLRRNTGINANRPDISVKANTHTTARTGHITFRAGSSTATLTVRQEAGSETISISPEGTVTFNAEGRTAAGNTTYQIAVTTNAASWSYDISYDSNASEDWITLRKYTGTNANKPDLSVKANTSNSARTGRITFRAGAATATLNVRQEAGSTTISITPDGTVNFTADGRTSAGNTTQQIVVTTNATSWTHSISYDQDAAAQWINVTTYTGVNANRPDISVKANTSNSARTGRITFRAGTATATLTVRQEAGSTTISITPDGTVTFNADGRTTAGNTTQQIVVATNAASWTHSISYDQDAAEKWINVTTYTGVNANRPDISVKANTKNTARTGSITFRAGTATATLTVRQEAGSTTISITPVGTVNFTADGKTTEGNYQQAIVVTTNAASWSYDISYDQDASENWITVHTYTSTSANQPAVSVKANTKTTPRTGRITFRAGGATATLTIVQAGKEGENSIIWTDYDNDITL